MNWGNTTIEDGIDLDLNCLFVDEDDDVSNIFSKENRGTCGWLSKEGSVQISKDDSKGDYKVDDGLENESVKINLSIIESNINQIFFFLNNYELTGFSRFPYNQRLKKDFSLLKHLKISIYDREAGKKIASYTVNTKECSGKPALIIGKFFKTGNTWAFQTIGDLTDDHHESLTIERIKASYLVSKENQTVLEKPDGSKTKMENNLEIKLEKGQRINLENADDSKITEFCVGLNWGTKYKAPGGIFIKKTDIDLDLNCIVIDDNNKIFDYLNCAAYKQPEGKFETDDEALKHSGDDIKGDTLGDDSLDNETISVDLSKIDNEVSQIIFFVNNTGENDFSQIPFVEVRIYEGTQKIVKNIFACYNISTEENNDKKAFIIGKLLKKGYDWEYITIDEATDDNNLIYTIRRIEKSYLL